MKVFISWSGERSKALAQGLRDWLPLVLHYVEPWLSEADIEAGERWADAVAKELEASNFGIISVTRENVSSPWILFEAGALAKSLQGSRVIPLLLDLDFRDITGPLAQFQAKKVENSGLSEVIHSINQAAEHAVPATREKQLFDALWPEFEKKVGSIPKQASAAKHTRSQNEILEELVASVRALDSRFREVAGETDRSIRYRQRRIHPFMVRELAEMIGQVPGAPISLLIISSMFREDAPWLYELGMEAYRAAKTGSPEEARRALRLFQRATEVIMKGHMSLYEEMGFDPKMVHMLAYEIERSMTREPQKEVTPKRKPTLKKIGQLEPKT